MPTSIQLRGKTIAAGSISYQLRPDCQFAPHRATPAHIRFRALPEGHRNEKFAALKKIDLYDDGWLDCPTDWRAPFLPESKGPWATYPKLEHLFKYNGSGVMPGRTWVIAPDAESLVKRWNKLIATPPGVEQERLFHPHLRNGKPGDKHSNKKVSASLAGQEERLIAVSMDKGPCVPPVRYAFRSLHRQWIIPDARLINQPNPGLWGMQSDQQVFLTALAEKSPESGPALTVAGLIPDLDHYRGSFGGRVFPLWSDAAASKPNLSENLINVLSERYGRQVSAEDLFAYIVGIAAHPGYTARFREDLSTPGLRVPITSAIDLFRKVADIGRRVIWLHSYGERMADPKKGQPAALPRAPEHLRPNVPKEGTFPPDMLLPDELRFEADKQRLHLGVGFIELVSKDVLDYEIDGKQVVTQWFSYRKRNRGKPPMGDKRPPSPLQDIQPDYWLTEYTTELLNLLNVLTLLVELEPEQKGLLDAVCNGALIAESELLALGAIMRDASSGASQPMDDKQATLFA